MSDLVNNDYCFGCGTQNPVGLGLQFRWSGAVCEAVWTPKPEHQGWAGRVHGGLLALVLDEALSRAALDMHGLHWVTAELTTRLHAPAALDAPLWVTAWVVSARPRLVVCAGEVRSVRDNALVAAGSAKMMQPTR